MEQVLAAHHVGVHARTGDVFAKLVDQQHVGVVKRQPRHPLLGQHEQLLFSRLELLGRHGLQLGGFVVAVFDDGQAGDNAAVLEHLPRHAADNLSEAVIVDRPVVDFGAFVLAKSDEHHLHQAAFDIAHEPRVRLDAADHKHVIRLVRELVEMDRNALGRLADDDGLHRGFDRAAAKLLGDAVALDNLALAFGRAPAVAAHGRHNKRFGAEGFEMVDGGLDDRVNVGDAAAARRYGHALTRLDLLPEIQFGELALDFVGNVVDTRAVKRLTKTKHLGESGHRRGSGRYKTASAW